MTETKLAVDTSALASELRALVRGRVTTAQDPDWDAQRTAWHLLVDQQPAVVVHVSDPEEVAVVVRVADRAGLTVTAQPVGHGATGNVDGTVLLRTSALDRIDIDVDRRVARVGAGVRWRDLNAALAGTGLTGLPGSSGDTTVVGYTLGGGLGWFGRRYGQASAHVLAFEVVDVGGVLRRITAETDPDLFWALRGGGGDFAVVTAMEFALHPLESLYGGRLVWPATRAAEVLHTFARVTADAPDELTLWAWLLNMPDLPQVPEPMRGRSFVAIDHTFLGEIAEADALLAPLYAVGGIVMDSSRPMTIDQIGTIAAEPEEPVPGRLVSRFLASFDGDAIDALLDSFRPGEPSALFAAEVRHLGGALRSADDLGAAGSIDEEFFFLTGGFVQVPELEPAVESAIDDVLSALEPWSSERVALNFASNEPVDQLFSADTLSRLRRIKQDRDPRRVLRSNHPVDDGRPSR